MSRYTQHKKLYSGLGFMVFVLLLLGSFAYFYEAPPSLAAPLTSQQGKELFAKNCMSCHGDEAVGQDPQNNPRGGMDSKDTYIAPALNGKGHAWHHSDEVLFNTIKNGSLAEDSSMRAHKDHMSDDEIKAVILYFKSLWPRKIQVQHAQRSKTQ